MSSFEYIGTIDGLKPLSRDIEKYNGRFRVIVNEDDEKINMVLDGTKLVEKLYDDQFEGKNKCVVRGPVD